MGIGAGYDMGSRESLPSPFEKVTIDNTYDDDTFAQVEVQAQLFRNEKDLANALESLTTASISYLSTASVNAVATYLKAAVCNETNMCLVMRCAISMPPEHFDRELVLSTPAAKNLQAGLSTFTNCYGEYCVEGQIRQSSFYAVVTYSSESAQELDQFAATLSVTGETKSVNFDAASGLFQRIESQASSVRESHKFHMTGVAGGGGLEWLEDANVSEAWQGFRDEYAPVPQVALLKHYSSIMPGKIPRPTRHYEGLRDVTEAAWKCALLQLLARSVPQNRDTTTSKLERLAERLDVLSNSRDEADVDEVRQIVATLETFQTELRKPAWPVIRAELDKHQRPEYVTHPPWTLKSCHCRLLTAYRNRWSHGPLDSCGEDVWEFGITPARATELGIAADDIATDVKACILPDTGKIVTQKPDPLRLELPGRKIIGALLKNKYHDPHQGGKWAPIGSWLGSDTFGVKVETRHTRGCNWELTVWSISSKIFET